MTLKKILFIIIALVCVSNAYSQGFNSVVSKDGISVIAVGNNGNVFRSYDGGATFGSYPVGAVNLNSVVNIGNLIVIAANSALIYYSTNDGSTWNNQTLGAQNFNSVSFADANNGWAVGDNGTIYKTVNGGVNWTSQTSPNSNTLRGVKATSTSNAVACGDNGTVIYTVNGGTTWLAYTTGSTGRLLSVDQNGSTIIATGADGFILKYNGSSWTSINYKMVSKSEVRSVSMIDANTFYTAGGGGFVNKTTDAGTTRTYQMNPMIAPISAIYFYNSNTGFAVSSTTNAIIRTNNGGTSWNFQTGVTVSYSWPQKQATSGNIGNGFCINPQNKNSIFLMAGNVVYRSLDRGNTWAQVGTSPGSPYTGSCHSFFVSALDTNIWFASKGTSSGYVIKTTNYGATWSGVLGPLTLTSYGMPLEVDPSNPMVYYLAPDGAAIRKTTDMGATWTNLGGRPSFGTFRSPCDVVIQFENPNVIFVADGVTSSGANGEFYKSTDGGVTFSLVHATDPSEEPMIANTSLDLSLVFHTTWSSGGFWKSTNQGSNFTLTTGPQSSLWAADIAKDDPTAVMYGTYGATGYLSTNSGSSFITQSLVSSPGAGELYYDKSTCLMQQGGGIYKLNVTYTVPVVTGNHQISSEIPKEFAVSQNYPNPFNPTTQIKYGVPTASQVKITVYDISGRIVETLVNGMLQAGTYSATFDASNLSSGMYFYKIEAGSFVSTKKMALIK